MTVNLYDPLTYDNLMAGLVMHFEKQATERLDSVAGVEGPGIYSLFYSGDFHAYEPISRSEKPIYVGKAVPPGSRKGSRVDESIPALQRRIREHSKSIGQADNPLYVEFSLEAKCYRPPLMNDQRPSAVGVKEVSRLISRIRYRQFGVLVTTSVIGKRAYRRSA